MKCCTPKKPACCGIGYKSIPAALGDDTGPFKPENGAYHNMLIRYEENGALYLYTNDGIFTQLDGERFFLMIEKWEHDTSEELEAEIDQRFSDLNVQSEIDHKLNEMVADGTLAEIIDAYLQTNVAWTFDTVADMKSGENFVNGSYAQTLGFYSAGDGGSSLYKIRNITNEDVVDNITIIPITGSETLCAELVITKNMVVDQFGAKGDGVHDDSDNIQAYINHATTGFNVHLNTSNKLYKITKTIDLKNKGLIGTGYRVGNNSDNGLLFVDSGNYTNNSAIINFGTGNELKNINIISESTTLDCIHVASFFNNIFDTVSIKGFSTQVVIDNTTVASRYTNCYFIGFETYGIHIKGLSSVTSTTTWFDKCEFCYANGQAFKCGYSISNFNFDNVIFEAVNGAIQARTYRSCNFNCIWCERTRDGVVRDWLVNDVAQQIVGCTFSNLRMDAKWTNRASADIPSNGDTAGGVTNVDDKLVVAGSTGRKVMLDSAGLSTKFVNGSNSYSRALIITTQDKVGSNVIPIRIKAPNNQLYLENQDDSSTPVKVRSVIGEKDGNKVYVESCITPSYSHQSYTDPVSNVASQYTTPKAYVFCPQYQSPSNGGYTLTKDDVNQEFVLSKVNSDVPHLKYPSIIVSGIIVGSALGNNTDVVIPTFKLDEPFSGAYNAYSTASGVHIKFYKLDGTVVMPTSFTLHITEEKK